MNKSELIEAIAEKTGLTKADSEKALNAFITTIITEVRKGSKITVSGLGSFERIIRKARTGINPANGTKITIPAKNAPKFKPAKSFKDQVAS